MIYEIFVEFEQDRKGNRKNIFPVEYTFENTLNTSP